MKSDNACWSYKNHRNLWIKTEKKKECALLEKKDKEKETKK